MFAQPFWPEGFFDVVCTDSFIPEFWVTSPPSCSRQHTITPDSTCHVTTSHHTQQSAQPSAKGAGISQQADSSDGEQPQGDRQHVLHEAQAAAVAQGGSGCPKQTAVGEGSSRNDVQQQQQQQQQFCMVGFVAGSKAEEISKLRQNSVVIKTLSQLDEMFSKLCIMPRLVEQKFEHLCRPFRGHVSLLTPLGMPKCKTSVHNMCL